MFCPFPESRRTPDGRQKITARGNPGQSSSYERSRSNRPHPQSTPDHPQGCSTQTDPLKPAARAVLRSTGRTITPFPLPIPSHVGLVLHHHLQPSSSLRHCTSRKDGSVSGSHYHCNDYTTTVTDVHAVRGRLAYVHLAVRRHGYPWPPPGPSESNHPWNRTTSAPLNLAPTSTGSSVHR